MTWVKIPLEQAAAVPSGVLFDTVGTHSWTVPAGVISISAVAVGGGGGGGSGSVADDGGQGGVRIIWGIDRSFPSTNVDAVSSTDPETTV